jgi:hypothetical protein
MRYRSKYGTVLAAEFVLMLCASSLLAGPGGLSSGAIDKIRGSFEMDAHTRAMYNSITNNDISGLALNRDVLRSHNEIFSHKIEAKGITNQTGISHIRFTESLLQTLILIIP